MTESITTAKTEAPVAAVTATPTAKPAVAAKSVAATKPARAVKTVAKRRARKAAVKLAATSKPIRRAAKTTRRATTKPAAATRAATSIEGIAMNYDFTKPFAGLELGAFQFPGADRFQSLFGDAGSRGQELASKGRQAAEEMTEMAKANVEAIVEASRIAATGAKAIGQDVLTSSRDGLEQAAQSLKTLSQAGSPTEFVQLQSELVRSSFDRMVAESAKLTEQFVKLAGDAIQPISNRASVNAERANELMA
jgi:phasin family protein